MLVPLHNIKKNGLWNWQSINKDIKAIQIYSLCLLWMVLVFYFFSFSIWLYVCIIGKTMVC
jgi:hypothetical protein